MTAFGWNDSGGGTMRAALRRRASSSRRGWDVTVFHAAVEPDPSGVPYARARVGGGRRQLVGVHNRPHGLLDIGHPDRELDDPPITAAFADVLDRVRPDVVHFHNLHNLGAALIDVAAARGIRSFFTTAQLLAGLPARLPAARRRRAVRRARRRAAPTARPCVGGDATPAATPTRRLDDDPRAFAARVDQRAWPCRTACATR